MHSHIRVPGRYRNAHTMIRFKAAASTMGSVVSSVETAPQSSLFLCNVIIILFHHFSSLFVVTRWETVTSLGGCAQRPRHAIVRGDVWPPLLNSLVKLVMCYYL